jgi:hypothetical protein
VYSRLCSSIPVIVLCTEEGREHLAKLVSHELMQAYLTAEGLLAGRGKGRGKRLLRNGIVRCLPDHCAVLEDKGLRGLMREL